MASGNANCGPVMVPMALDCGPNGQLLTEWFAGLTHGLPSDDVRMGLVAELDGSSSKQPGCGVHETLSLMLVIVRDLIRHSLQ